jgi:hypothetical protein
VSTTNVPQAAGFRVSVREVKDAGYRGLRSAGYSWGEAQSAGRVAATAEVLWAQGVSDVSRDAKRWRVRRRHPNITRAGNTLSLKDPRKTSAIILGSHAMALALSNPDSIVRVKGSVNLRNVAAAIWDIKPTGATVTWGSSKECNSNSYRVDELGNLFRNPDLSEILPELRTRTTGWFITAKSVPGGELILSITDREIRMNESLSSGVQVDPHGWRSLQKSARKFLVPE